MALDKDTQHHLERYLEGEMTPIERTNFELKINAQKELKQAVQLHREMEDFLSDSTENELRKNLQKLNNKVEDLPPKGNSNWKYWIGVLALSLIGFLWYVSSNSQKPKSTNSNEIPDQEITTTSIIDSTTSKESPDSPNKNESPQKAEKELNPPIEDKPKENVDRKINRAIATENSKDEAHLAGGNPLSEEETKALELLKPEPDARDYFEPFSILENKKRLNFESENLSIKIIEKLPDTIHLVEAQEKKYIFTASINSEFSIEKDELALYIYSNSEYHWEQQTPWLAYALRLETLDNNNYLLRANIAPNLEIGRYYYILSNRITQKIYTLADFVIVE